MWFIIPPLPEVGGGYTVLPLSVLPSVQDIFCRIFLSNCWWQKSDIWSQASYRYTILWVAFLDPSDSYFLFADFVDFYIHLTYICICTFFVAFFSATIDDRNLIFGHQIHIGMPYCGRRFCICPFLVHFSQQLLMTKSDIWSQDSYRYRISWEAFLNQSDSYFLLTDFVDFYTHLTYICICTFFVAFFSATIDDRNLFGHKLHIGMPYCGKRFWTRQIPTSCLPTLLIFLHIEHICSFFVAFFSATIDGRNRFLTRQIPTSCLPKSGVIIGEH